MTFLFPMPAWGGRAPGVSSGYGPREGGHYSTHYGVDILYRTTPEEAARKNQPREERLPEVAASGNWIVPSNTIPALSIADGVVELSSDIGTGGRVRVDHGDGLKSAYYHLRNRRVNVGERVKRGQILGTVSYDASKDLHLNHLHFEIWKNGKQVDPAPYLKGAEVAPMPTPRGWLIAGAVAFGLGIYAVRKKII
jgi:murein DD-endopeptidase MepM/ murein hydrolase activator NlpD